MTASRRISFPNLDGLRFFAFLSVFLFHSFYTKEAAVAQHQVFQVLKTITRHGDLGVNLFFVLSGFLITYLLLNEKDLRGQINIPAFYMRRVLRIWPLYFLMVFVGFVVFPFMKAHFGQTDYVEPARPWYYLTFLSNFNTLYYGSNTPTLTLLWSVAIEEQFYLVWPLLVALVPKRYMGWLFGGIIVASGAFRLCHLHDVGYLNLHTFSVISDMAVGGAFAWLCYTQSAFTTQIGAWPQWLIALVYFLGIILIFNREILFIWPPYAAFDRLVLSVFFAFIILEQNYAQHSLFKMANWRFPSFWGTYTYGLYCWHFLTLLLAYQILHRLGANKTAWGALLGDNLLGLSLALTVSWLSYHSYEKFFLKWKDKFAYVVRHDKAT